VLILRGVAGPDDGYTEIARRLAEWGYVALVHGWKVRGTDPVDGLVYADLQGAMTFLESVGQADLQRLAVFGFCRGGVHAVMAARAHPEIRVVAVFHGFAFRPAGAQPGAEPYDLAEGVSCTVRRTSGRPLRTCVGWRRGCGRSARPARSGSTTALATASPCAPTPAMPMMREAEL
jgi:dienelactone hydrolase